VNSHILWRCGSIPRQEICNDAEGGLPEVFFVARA